MAIFIIDRMTATLIAGSHGNDERSGSRVSTQNSSDRIAIKLVEAIDSQFDQVCDLSGAGDRLTHFIDLSKANRRTNFD